MTERTRIILGMSLIELELFQSIGGLLPIHAANRLRAGKLHADALVAAHGVAEARRICPPDIRFLIDRDVKAPRAA